MTEEPYRPELATSLQAEDGLRLIRAFTRIGDAHMRSGLITLMEGIAAVCDTARADGPSSRV